MVSLEIYLKLKRKKKNLTTRNLIKKQIEHIGDMTRWKL
jgi:hypothetical protein